MLLLFIDSIVLDSGYIAGANIERTGSGKAARLKSHLVTFGKAGVKILIAK